MTRMPVTPHRLLLVDDDPVTTDLVKLRLSRYGYIVSTAANGAEALRHIREREYDLVLMDVMMPGLSGYEVLREIRRSHSLLSLPVIMVTAHDSRDHIVKALEAGANDYLVKPLDINIALARVRTQLTCKNLSATKDEFLFFASHDLKKPLMLMQDIAEQLHQQLPPGSTAGEQVQRDLEYLIRSAQNMTKVVEGFLNQETFRSGSIMLDKLPVRPEQIVEEVVLENDAYAKSKGITLRAEHQDYVPEVQADEQKIKEVIDNLIGNAIKFSPSGSSVHVRTRCDDEYVYIDIRDSGPGLKASDFASLFTARAVLSNKPTGNETSSGFGLAICHSLIEQHDGRIGAENNPDAGATFWIALPLPVASTTAMTPLKEKA